MARQGVTLMCYWNGKTTIGPHGISYEGAAPKPIRVSYGITHNELLDKIFRVTGFDKHLFKLKIICRYPACREYIPVPIDDDESIDIMFDVARQPGTNCMELYVEREPVCNDNEVNSTEQAPVNNQTPLEMASHEAQVDGFLDPGPVDNSVLVLQNQHRTEAIWTGEDPGVLTCRQRLATMMREWHLDPRLSRFIIQIGFYGVYRIGFIQLDWPLITALVERWRQETHTFHFTVGESTVTLQDVSVLLGVRIDGLVVTGNGDLQWEDICEELLGVRPDPSVLHGSALKLSWLRSHFHEPPPDASDATLLCYARAYILGLMGGVLFTDKSGADVQLIFLPLLRDFTYAEQFSWGSAALAHLYRELCRATKKGAIEIAGPLILLQLWAWERLTIGHPERLGGRVQDADLPDIENGEQIVDEEQLPPDPLGCRWRGPVIRRDNPQRALIFYRDQLDQQTDDQMIWQPYTPERLAVLPDACLRDQHIWRSITPLICFDIVEWHHPDRVLRQFGLRQGIPMHCDTEVKLHTVDRRGRHHYNWKVYHGKYIQLWGACQDNIATGEPDEQRMHYHDPYMVWFRNITRRLITPLTQRPHMRFQPSSATAHLLIQSLTSIHNQCTVTLDTFTSDGAMKSLADIQTTCFRVLKMIGETRHLEGISAAATTANQSITTAISSVKDANAIESQQLNDKGVASPPAQRPVRAKAPSIRGRGRSRGRGKGKAVVAAASIPSLPELIATSAASQCSKHLDGSAIMEQMDLLSPAEEIEKTTDKIAKSISVLDEQKEGEQEVVLQEKQMELLEADKLAVPIEAASMMETEAELMNMLDEEDVEATPFLLEAGSKARSSLRLIEEESNNLTSSKKKKSKHN